MMETQIFGTWYNERKVLDSNGDIGDLGLLQSPIVQLVVEYIKESNYGIGFGDGSNGRPDFQLVPLKLFTMWDWW